MRRLQMNILNARVPSSTRSTKPFAFYEKTDFYLKNKLELLGEGGGAVFDPVWRWRGRTRRFPREIQVSGKRARISHGSRDILWHGP